MNEGRDHSVKTEVVPESNSPTARPHQQPSGNASSGYSSLGPPPSSTGFELKLQQTPFRLREVLAVLTLVVLYDTTLYRGFGFAGYAVLFLTTPILLLLGTSSGRRSKGGWLIYLMLLVLAVKLVWSGSVLLTVCGVLLLLASAMLMAGFQPFFLDLVVFTTQTPLAGFFGVVHLGRSCEAVNRAFQGKKWLNICLPMAALILFGMIFILANPDLMKTFGQSVEHFFQIVRDWILGYSPGAEEITFWFVTAVISVGLLRPLVKRTGLTGSSEAKPKGDKAEAEKPSELYAPFRNTLVAVIVLFAVYLVFEFQTLWFREFPAGFYYSGYAHQGAAWLTVALATATVVLSLIFRESILADARLAKLRRLAWLWSLENLLLVAAVYNRVFIYIGFNGMTRMRMVGLFGISAVVVGFILVLWKIAHNRNFLWLIRRDLIALAVAIYLFAVMPIDAIVVSYNVRRVLAGDPAASMQIAFHPISNDGVLLLLPLVDSSDEKIREGVRALLARHQEETEARYSKSQQQGWTAYQCSDRYVLEALQSKSKSWSEYGDRVKREEAFKRFKEYAYQWY